MSSSALKLKTDNESASKVIDGEKITRRVRPILSDLAICLSTIVLISQVYLHGTVGGTSLQNDVWLAIFIALVAVRFGRHLILGNHSRELPLSVVILGDKGAATALNEALKFSNRHLLVNAPNAEGSGRIRCGIVAIPEECDAKTLALVEQSAKIFKQLYVAPQINGDEITANALLDGNADLRIHVGHCPAASENHFLKRVFDLYGALLLGIVALPFVLFVALAIRLTSRGPVLFKQLRIGKGNRLFYALKFRTMFMDSADRLNHHLEKNAAMRVQWESVHKLKDDPRVTWIGRFLRRFSFDELPQIWNVLVGDMSLIGPRPIVISEIERYGVDYAAYEAVRPGLTGLWQVSGRNDTTYQERVNYDSYYVRNWSLALDLRIVARTFRAVISGAGAY